MFLSASIWKSREIFGAAALAVVIEVLTLVHLRIGLDFMAFLCWAQRLVQTVSTSFNPIAARGQVSLSLGWCDDEFLHHCTSRTCSFYMSTDLSFDSSRSIALVRT